MNFSFKNSFQSIEHLSFIFVFTFELNIAYKIIFKTMLYVRKEHITLHITIFVQQYLHDNNCTHNTSYSW